MDSPFYERVLASAGLAGVDVQIVRAVDIAVDGVSAGGKGHALRIFRKFRETAKLRQANRTTTVDWVFFLDADDDVYLGQTEASPHVIYTEHSDVEAEILINSDLHDVVSLAFSLSSVDASRVQLDDIALELASIWREWIRLRLASCSCNVASARYASHSQVNKTPYGPVLTASVDALKEIHARAAGEDVWAHHYALAGDHIQECDETARTARLVKGKWLPGFIVHKVRDSVGRERALGAVTHATILSVALARLDFDRAWADTYRGSIAKLMAA